MQSRIVEVRKILSKIGYALFGMSPEPMKQPPNRGVESYIFHVPDALNSGGSPDQFPANTDLVLIDELAKGDEPSE